ncbi:MAG: biotin/lipoyl-containing protein [Flexilinea sp.]
MKLTIKVEEKTFAVEIADPNANPMVVNVEGTEFKVYSDNAPRSIVSDTIISGRAVAAPAPAKSATVAGSDVVKAPIPGVIQEVNVKEGQSVKKGEILFVLEAMKMKNNITANHAGTIASVNVNKGDAVTHGQVLLSYAD